MSATRWNLWVCAECGNTNESTADDGPTLRCMECKTSDWRPAGGGR